MFQMFLLIAARLLKNSAIINLQLSCPQVFPEVAGASFSLSLAVFGVLSHLPEMFDAVLCAPNSE